MGKMSYSIEVTGTSSVIVPDINAIGTPFEAGTPFVTGDYIEYNGTTYWAMYSSTMESEPEHTRGIAPVTGTAEGPWMALPRVRKVVISCDEDNAVFATKGGTAIAGEGMKMDGYRPAWDLGIYSGTIAAITDGVTATLAIEFTAG